MLKSGIPETLDEAQAVVTTAASTTFDQPAHYPHSQIVALAQLVADLTARVEQLEAKPKRGRPPKNPTVDLVDRVAEAL